MKIIKYILVISIFIFSFYYTEKSMDILKLKDPIMTEIKNNLDKYKVEPVNAIINNNTIVPGTNGQEVDIEKTYNRMKKYGTYNEGLTKIKETTPEISIKDNYDKYIKLTSSDNKKIALLFIINKETNLNKIINILNRININTTLYIEDNQIENNIELLKNIKYEIELLNVNKEYFISKKSYIETLTNQELKYCFTTSEDNELLNLCKKNQMHTIIPSLIVKKNLYKTIKNNIESSPIIAIYPSMNIENELVTTINYLKQKGYKFYDLKTLLNEER